MISNRICARRLDQHASDIRRRRMGKLRIWVLIVCSSLALCGPASGCRQDDLDRQVLYGRVTYNGQKVTGGDILFVPVGDTVGPITGATIHNGEYRADHRGGVPIGKHTIRVRGFLGEVPATPQGGPDNITYPTVPPEFYTASKIEIELVPGSTQGEKHFDLLSGMTLRQLDSP